MSTAGAMECVPVVCTGHVDGGVKGGCGQYGPVNPRESWVDRRR